jgi:hypothetical protein
MRHEGGGREAGDDQRIDASQHVRWNNALGPDGKPVDPMIKPERLAKGDWSFTRDCELCKGRGTQPHESGFGTVPCPGCYGRGKTHDAPDTPIHEVRYAQAQVQNVLNWLYERDLLTDQHVFDGQTYEIWREVYQARRTMRRKDPLYSVRGYEETEAQCEYGYSLLLVRLPVRHHRTVEYAVATFATSHARQVAQRSQKSILHAFEALSRMMPDVREEVKRLRERDPVQAKEEAEFRLRRLTGREELVF